MDRSEALGLTERERRGDENKFTIFLTIALIELLSVCSTYRVDGREVEGVGDRR